jgi:histidinol-phosphate aminotransferase
MIESLIRENIKRLKPYTSARDEYSQGILLDANENSFGSSFNGNGLELNRYPDPHQADLKSAVGKYYNVKERNLFFGVGSDEIIDLLIRIFCEPKEDSVMILQPTYGMYEVACGINNVKAIHVDLDKKFHVDFDAVAKNFTKDVKLIFLCSPNNPTGGLINKEDILKLCSSYNAIIVVDEAYMDFSQKDSLLSDRSGYENLVVLRTFSKAWGLAGIRLGFCAANEKVIEYLFKVKAPYNINRLTRHALKQAIANAQQKDDFVKRIIEEREKLSGELKSITYIEEVFPTDANYILFRCPNAKAVQKCLADKGVIIRYRGSHPALKDCLRVTVGKENENKIFIEELKKCLSAR